MSISNTGRAPGGESYTPKKAKPGRRPGFGKDSETYFTRSLGNKKAAELLTLLRQRHPVIRDYLPLVIGIHQAIGAVYPEFGKTAIWRALKFHSQTYLKNLAAGGYRYDVTGQPWGLITPEHQRQAQEQLEKTRPKPAGPPPPKAALFLPSAQGAALNTKALNRPTLSLKNRTYAAILSRSRAGNGVWGFLRMRWRLNWRHVISRSKRSRSTIR